jgi:hypothetical protein
MFAHHHAFIPEVFRLVRFGDDESRLIGFTIPPFSLPARHSRAAYSRAPNPASVPTPASHSAGVSVAQLQRTFGASSRVIGRCRSDDRDHRFGVSA